MLSVLQRSEWLETTPGHMFEKWHDGQKPRAAFFGRHRYIPCLNRIDMQQ
jgi:hypothetical protein